MKRAVRCAALVVLVVSVGPIGCGRRDEPPERIILVVVDTLRRDHVSPYGSAIPTPNIQRLADAGQVFSNAIASFHQTTMSMAALFTGRTPSLESGDSKEPLPWTGRNWCGMTRFAEGPKDSCVPQGLTTLAEDLKRAGYFTVGVASNRFLFRPAGYDQGFDEWLQVAADEPDELPQILSRERSGVRVQAAVEEVLSRIPEQPLFLYVHYMEAHDYGLWGGSYANAVAMVDAHLGRLLDLLEARGLLDDSVVFFTSDHGEVLREKYGPFRTKTHNGNPSFQPVLEIPLIVSPARFEDPDVLIRSQDIGGLVREVAGVPSEPDSAPGLARDELFTSELNYLTYRKGPFKSVFHRRRMQSWGLFDLEADPGEQVNLIEEKREIAMRHLARVGELARAFAAPGAADPELSEEDRVRLRSLGYTEE